MNYCVIDENCKVVNIIVWDGETAYNPGTGLRVVPRPIEDGEQAAIDWTYDPDTNTFSPPVPTQE